MIGIFDSGIGGLSMMRRLLEICPEYDYCYFADSLRAPYGGKSEDQIFKYTKESVDALFTMGATLVVLACNTASLVSLKKLQAIYPEKKILGVVIPTAEEALKKSRYGNIGIVGTKYTIASKGFDDALYEREKKWYLPKEKKAKASIQIFSQACPLLVPLIEEGWEKKPETKMILKKYLLKLKSCHVDTLILGCTHYPLIAPQFQRIMGKNCTLIDSGKVQAESLKDYFFRHPEIETLLPKNKKRQFFTTDNPEHFSVQAKKFLRITINAQSYTLS